MIDQSTATLSPADLDRIADRVSDRLANEPQLLTFEQLEKRTGLSETTLRRLRTDGVIHDVGPYGCVRFYLPDVIAALRKRAGAIAHE